MNDNNDSMKLEIGQGFPNIESCKKYFDEWANRNNVELRIHNSHYLNGPEDLKKKFLYKYLNFACVHYGQPRIRKGKQANDSKEEPETQIRKKTHSLKSGCPCIISIKYDKESECLRIIKLNLTHNHELLGGKAKQLYNKNRQPNDEQLKSIQQLLKYKTPITGIKDFMKENHNKFITDRDVHNIKYKMEIENKNKSEEERLAGVLCEMKSNQHFVELYKNANNELECIFITFRQQFEWFKKYPSFLHIDSTFKVNIENYLLYVFLGHDSNLRGIPFAFCLMKNETTPNMEFMYDTLTKVFDNNLVEIIMIDKDLQNIDLLRRYFPNSNLLLCTFHVIKYLKQVVAEEESKENKQNVMNLISDLVYCKDDLQYLQILKKLKEITTDKFYEYFIKNWDNCKDMWVQFYRRFLKLQGTHTNNYIEAFNRLAKRIIDANFHISKTIEILNKIIDEFEMKQNLLIIENMKVSTDLRVRNSTFMNKIEEICNRMSIMLILEQDIIAKRNNYVIEEISTEAKYSVTANNKLECGEDEKKLQHKYNGLCHPDYYGIRDSLAENYANSIFIANTSAELSGGSHWIAISNKDCDSSTWRVYDSLDYAVKNYKDLFKTILPNCETVIIQKIIVTRQKDSKNCGLHALANVMALVDNLNPSDFEWINKNNEMRDHFRKCINNSKASQFVSKPKRSQRELKSELLILKEKSKTK